MDDAATAFEDDVLPAQPLRLLLSFSGRTG
jgi:hypothetical protein